MLTLPEKNKMEERNIIIIPCAHCMALINVIEVEYHACTHFACSFCGKITNISQVLLGANWNWTLAGEYNPDLPLDSKIRE